MYEQKADNFELVLQHKKYADLHEVDICPECCRLRILAARKEGIEPDPQDLYILRKLFEQY